MPMRARSNTSSMWTRAQFYFLEVNTRLQVEHGVTEEVTGIDLVEWMVRQAAGEALPDKIPEPQGASIQVRVYAEEPARDFRPSSGLLTKVEWPAGTRVETWVESGSDVTSYYDPMMAKIIVTGQDRPGRFGKTQAGAEGHDARGHRDQPGLPCSIWPPAVNSRDGEITTTTLASLAYAPETFEILVPGTLTSVQDYPGRVGYWDVGVPPSGPMDHVSFRLANRAVGNAEGTAALEMTVSGPTLIRFSSSTVVCLVGADMGATLDGAPVRNGEVFMVQPGQVLKCGTISGPGLRTYLALQGGIDVPDYLGSKSTFSLGAFGGHGGRALRTGDVLRLQACRPPGFGCQCRYPRAVLPTLTQAWDIGVLYGPHGAPDFFTEDDIATFFAADWDGALQFQPHRRASHWPQAAWARADGGEAGLHPSNMHDNAYAIGAINFTGDMPVILGPDGPSLGGFVCPVTIVQAELWKIGQLRPGDKVRFKRLTAKQPAELEHVKKRRLRP